MKRRIALITSIVLVLAATVCVFAFPASADVPYAEQKAAELWASNDVVKATQVVIGNELISLTDGTSGTLAVGGTYEVSGGKLILTDVGSRLNGTKAVVSPVDGGLYVVINNDGKEAPLEFKSDRVNNAWKNAILDETNPVTPEVATQTYGGHMPMILSSDNGAVLTGRVENNHGEIIIMGKMGMNYDQNSYHTLIIRSFEFTVTNADESKTTHVFNDASGYDIVLGGTGTLSMKGKGGGAIVENRSGSIILSGAATVNIENTYVVNGFSGTGIVINGAAKENSSVQIIEDVNLNVTIAGGLGINLEQPISGAVDSFVINTTGTVKVDASFVSRNEWVGAIRLKDGSFRMKKGTLLINANCIGFEPQSVSSPAWTYRPFGILVFNSAQNDEVGYFQEGGEVVVNSQETATTPPEKGTNYAQGIALWHSGVMDVSGDSKLSIRTEGTQISGSPIIIGSSGSATGSLNLTGNAKVYVEQAGAKNSWNCIEIKADDKNTEYWTGKTGVKIADNAQLEVLASNYGVVSNTQAYGRTYDISGGTVLIRTATKNIFGCNPDDSSAHSTILDNSYKFVGPLDGNGDSANHRAAYQENPSGELARGWAYFGNDSTYSYYNGVQQHAADMTGWDALTSANGVIASYDAESSTYKYTVPYATRYQVDNQVVTLPKNTIIQSSKPISIGMSTAGADNVPEGYVMYADADGVLHYVADDASDDVATVYNATTGSFSFDAKNKKVTLNGLAGKRILFALPGDYEVELVGENKFTRTDAGSDSNYTFRFEKLDGGKATLTGGEGDSLKIDAKNSVFVLLAYRDLYFDGDFDVVVDAKDDPIHGSLVALSFKDTNVTVTASAGNGIRAATTLTIDGATVSSTISADTALRGTTGIEIKNQADVYAECGTTNAITTDGQISINNSKVTAYVNAVARGHLSVDGNGYNKPNCDYGKYGINAGNGIVITDCNADPDNPDIYIKGGNGQLLRAAAGGISLKNADVYVETTFGEEDLAWAQSEEANLVDGYSTTTTVEGVETTTWTWLGYKKSFVRSGASLVYAVGGGMTVDGGSLVVKGFTESAIEVSNTGFAVKNGAVVKAYLTRTQSANGKHTDSKAQLGTSSQNAANMSGSNAIRVNGNTPITITDSTVWAEAYQRAIYANGGNLTISGNSDVDAFGRNAIRVEGILSIQGGDVHAEGYDYVIDGRTKLEILGGAVSTVVDDQASLNSSNLIEIKGGNINTKAKRYDIYSSKNIVIEGGTVISNAEYRAINAPTSITFKGDADVTANANGPSEGTYAVSSATVTVEGTANVKAKSLGNYAIHATTLNLNGGVTDATSTGAMAIYSTTLNVSGEDTVATASSPTSDYKGVVCISKYNQTGGTMNIVINNRTHGNTAVGLEFDNDRSGHSATFTGGTLNVKEISSANNGATSAIWSNKNDLTFAGTDVNVDFMQSQTKGNVAGIKIQGSKTIYVQDGSSINVLGVGLSNNVAMFRVDGGHLNITGGTFTGVVGNFYGNNGATNTVSISGTPKMDVYYSNKVNKDTVLNAGNETVSNEIVWKTGHGWTDNSHWLTTNDWGEATGNPSLTLTLADNSTFAMGLEANRVYTYDGKVGLLIDPLGELKVYDIPAGKVKKIASTGDLDFTVPSGVTVNLGNTSTGSIFTVTGNLTIDGDGALNVLSSGAAIKTTAGLLTVKGNVTVSVTGNHALTTDESAESGIQLLENATVYAGVEASQSTVNAETGEMTLVPTSVIGGYTLQTNGNHGILIDGATLLVYGNSNGIVHINNANAKIYIKSGLVAAHSTGLSAIRAQSGSIEIGSETTAPTVIASAAVSGDGCGAMHVQVNGSLSVLGGKLFVTAALSGKNTDCMAGIRINGDNTVNTGLFIKNGAQVVVKTTATPTDSKNPGAASIFVQNGVVDVDNASLAVYNYGQHSPYAMGDGGSAILLVPGAFRVKGNSKVYLYHEAERGIRFVTDANMKTGGTSEHWMTEGGLKVSGGQLEIWSAHSKGIPVGHVKGSATGAVAKDAGYPSNIELTGGAVLLHAPNKYAFDSAFYSGAKASTNASNPFFIGNTSRSFGASATGELDRSWSDANIKTWLYWGNNASYQYYNPLNQANANVMVSLTDGNYVVTPPLATNGTKGQYVIDGVVVPMAVTDKFNSGAVNPVITLTNDQDYSDGLYIRDSIGISFLAGTDETNNSYKNGAIVYNAADDTATFTNASVSQVASYHGGLNVTLVGNNTIAAGDLSNALYVRTGNLALSGEGKLAVSTSNNYGICLDSGNLTVNGTTVEATALEYAVYLKVGNLSITDANFTAKTVIPQSLLDSYVGVEPTAGKQERRHPGSYTVYVVAGNFSINNSIVTVIADNEHAVCLSGAGATLTVDGEDTVFTASTPLTQNEHLYWLSGTTKVYDTAQRAIRLDGTNATFTINAGMINLQSYGYPTYLRNAGGVINVNGGTVNVTTGGGDHGLSAAGGINISGGKVLVNTKENFVDAKYVGRWLVQSDGIVTIKNGAEVWIACLSNGLHSNSTQKYTAGGSGAINVLSGANVHVKTGSFQSVRPQKGDLYVDGATLFAEGTTQTIRPEVGSVVISNSKVTVKATGGEGNTIVAAGNISISGTKDENGVYSTEVYVESPSYEGIFANGNITVDTAKVTAYVQREGGIHSSGNYLQKGDSEVAITLYTTGSLKGGGLLVGGNAEIQGGNLTIVQNLNSVLHGALEVGGNYTQTGGNVSVTTALGTVCDGSAESNAAFYVKNGSATISGGTLTVNATLHRQTDDSSIFAAGLAVNAAAATDGLKISNGAQVVVKTTAVSATNGDKTVWPIGGSIVVNNGVVDVENGNLAVYNYGQHDPYAASDSVGAAIVLSPGAFRVKENAKVYIYHEAARGIRFITDAEMKTGGTSEHWMTDGGLKVSGGQLEIYSKSGIPVGHVKGSAEGAVEKTGYKYNVELTGGVVLLYAPDNYAYDTPIYNNGDTSPANAVQNAYFVGNTGRTFSAPATVNTDRFDRKWNDANVKPANPTKVWMYWGNDASYQYYNPLLEGKGVLVSVSDGKYTFTAPLATEGLVGQYFVDGTPRILSKNQAVTLNADTVIQVGDSRTGYAIDIRWAAMSFVYQNEVWVPSTHQYVEGGWTHITDGEETAATVVITNHSEKPLHVNLTSQLKEEYEDLLNVTVSTETSKIPGVDAYLLGGAEELTFSVDLDGDKPEEDMKDVVVGTLTLTLNTNYSDYDETVNHKFLAANSETQRIEIYDAETLLSALGSSTEKAVDILSLREASYAANLGSVSLTAAKLRKPSNSKWADGNTEFIVSSAGGYFFLVNTGTYQESGSSITGLYKYQSPVSGPHDIEMLPNGDIVIAATNNGGYLCYIPLSQMTLTSNQITTFNASQYSTLKLTPEVGTNGHGISYVPGENGEVGFLWVLMDNKVAKVEIEGYGTALPTLKFGTDDQGVPVEAFLYPQDISGHGFSPIVGQPGTYALTAHYNAWTFDSSDMSITKMEDIYQCGYQGVGCGTTGVKNGHVKGMVMFEDGTAVMLPAEYARDTTDNYSSEHESAGFHIVKWVNGVPTHYKVSDKEISCYKVFPLMTNYQ